MVREMSRRVIWRRMALMNKQQKQMMFRMMNTFRKIGAQMRI